MSMTEPTYQTPTQPPARPARKQYRHTVPEIEARVSMIKAGLTFHLLHRPPPWRMVACIEWLRSRDRMEARIDECQRILGRGKDGGK
jgi:hypothetical protein